MDFYSAYRHGFVRVAACTHHTAIGDPAANAASVLGLARACHDDGVALAVFPELTLSGYSIEDILLQDTLLDAVEDDAARRRRRVRRPAAGAGRRRAAAASAPHLQHRGRHPPRRGARRGAQVVPADLSRVLRAPPDRPRRRRARHHQRRRRRGAVRSGSAVRRRPTCPASCCTSRSARTCSCRCRRAPRRRWPGRRCWPTCPAARSPSAAPTTARCSPARRRRAAWPPTSTPPPGRASRRTDLAWDGQTMIWENGVLLAESERFPKGERRSVADVDLDLLRAERLRMGTFDDNRRHHRASARRRSGRIEFALDPPAGDIGLRRSVERFPFVPADPRTAATGLLRGLQHPGRPGSNSGCARWTTRRSSSGSPAGSTRRTR